MQTVVPRNINMAKKDIYWKYNLEANFCICLNIYDELFFLKNGMKLGFIHTQFKLRIYNKVYYQLH